LQLHLLVRRQLVLNPDRHPHMQRFDFTFGIENFAELGQRLLFVDSIRLHGFVQSLHRILQLPLQIVKARRRLLNLVTHKRFLLRREIQFARMLHDHLGRKHRVSQIRRGRRHTRLYLLRRPVRRLRLLR
jgi:hypothetical protein